MNGGPRGDGRCRRVAAFYRPRWQRWLDELTVSLTEHTPLPSTLLDVEMRAFESNWVETHTDHPTTPTGNTITVAQGLYTTWRPTYQ